MPLRHPFFLAAFARRMVAMSNIYYLRPPAPRPAKGAEEAEVQELKIALNPLHLAAILIRGSVALSGQSSPQVETLARKFVSTATGPQQRASGRIPARSGSPAETSARADQNRSIAVPAAAQTLQKVLSVATVAAGKVKLDQSSYVTGARGSEILKLRSQFIAVPDDVLLARQERTRCVTFAVSSMERLADVVNDAVMSQRFMIENWAVNGGRPDIRFKYQAREPFGRVVHVNASEATDLRALAVRLASERDGPERLYVMAFSLNGSGR